jgi:hypothetical protein
MGLGREIYDGDTQESLALAGGGDAIARVQVTCGSSHDTRPSVRSILRSEVLQVNRAYPNDMSCRELQIILVPLYDQKRISDAPQGLLGARFRAVQPSKRETYSS